MTFVLLKPRLDGIWSSTRAPSLKVISATRSPFLSNELTKARDASRTAPQREPIELDTSSTSDRSTIRRCASPVLAMVTVFRRRQPHERRRQRRGRGDRDDVDAGRDVGRAANRSCRRPVGLPAAVPMIAGRKVRREDARRLAARVAAVEHARRAERGAVHRLRQLRLDHVGPAGVDRKAGEQQQHRQRAGDVDQGKALFVRDREIVVCSCPLPLWTVRPCLRNTQSNTGSPAP